MGAKVHGDTGGEQAQADGQRACDPGEVDATLQDEEVQNAEDQYQHRRLCKERGAAPRADDGKINQRRRRLTSIPHICFGCWDKMKTA